jgi:glycerol-1-phosphate dehydrogenase [NAD(P)+]
MSEHAGGLDLAALRSRLAAAPDAADLLPVGLRRVVTGEGALLALPVLLEQLLDAPGPLALLADATPMRRGQADLKPAVRDLLATLGREVRLVRAGPDSGPVHADEDTLAAVREDVRGAAGLVTVGSGTVADIGKDAAAALGGLPHVIVPTAASVNGYADDQSVLLRDGVKRTVPTRWPDALVLDPAILAGAPRAMSAAGLGDLVSMFTAPADWYLARAVGMGGGYSATAVALGREFGEEVLALAPSLGRHEPGAVARLAEILTVSGISMGVVGRTAPSSGMEHTVSHLLEMAAGRRGQPTALHGAKVGVSTVIAALTWRYVRRKLAEPGTHLCFPTTEEMRVRVHAAFEVVDPSGAMGRECWADYRGKLARWQSRPAAVEGFAATWAAHEPTLDALLIDPVRLVQALRTAGAPVRFADLDPAVDPASARWAVANCHLMRNRFTIADLACFLGVWDDDGVDTVLADAAALGAGL